MKCKDCGKKQYRYGDDRDIHNRINGVFGFWWVIWSFGFVWMLALEMVYQNYGWHFLVVGLIGLSANTYLYITDKNK